MRCRLQVKIDAMMPFASYTQASLQRYLTSRLNDGSCLLPHHLNSSFVFFNPSNISSQSSRLRSGFKSALCFARRPDLIGLFVLLLQAHGFLWIYSIVGLAAEARWHVMAINVAPNCIGMQVLLSDFSILI
jgi:hypothetical protein